MKKQKPPFTFHAHIPRGSGDAEYRIKNRRGQVVALVDPEMRAADGGALAERLTTALCCGAAIKAGRAPTYAELSEALGNLLSAYEQVDELLDAFMTSAEPTKAECRKQTDSNKTSYRVAKVYRRTIV